MLDFTGTDRTTARLRRAAQQSSLWHAPWLLSSMHGRSAIARDRAADRAQYLCAADRYERLHESRPPVPRDIVLAERLAVACTDADHTGKDAASLTSTHGLRSTGLCGRQRSTRYRSMRPAARMPIGGPLIRASRDDNTAARSTEPRLP